MTKYLHLTGNDFKWSHGYKADEGGAFAPGFHLPALTPQMSRKKPRQLDEDKENLTAADKYIKKVQDGAGSRKFKNFLGNKPMEQHTRKT
jgi:hypothetical protein